MKLIPNKNEIDTKFRKFSDNGGKNLAQLKNFNYSKV